jgi:hypothetical protein
MIPLPENRVVSRIEGRSAWRTSLFAALAFVMFFVAGSLAKAEDGQTSLRLPLTLESFPQISITGAAADQLSAAFSELNEYFRDDPNCFAYSGKVYPAEIEVLSDGPKFLSLVFTHYSCSGHSHSSLFQETVNLDLETGLRTKFLEYLPEQWIDSDDTQRYLQVLFVRFAEEFSADCANAYTYALPYDYMVVQLGLDETRHELLLQAHGLNYVDTPCSHIARVPVEWLKEAGFDRKLTEPLSPSP